jgi:TBC1 domain family member 2
MNPRSPPTRPHIGIHLSHFTTKTTNEWGEDDAWDSTSDSESPRQSTLTSSWNRSSISSAPKKVPRTPSPSSSNLAFSYTHVNAPNPSSYPPKPELMPPQAPKNGWTIVRTSHNKKDSESNINQRTDTGFEQDGDSRDVDVEGDMILGDFEAEMSATDMDASIASLASNSKPRHNERAIRQDISDIINGILSSVNQFPHSTLAHKAVLRFFKIL